MYEKGQSHCIYQKLEREKASISSRTGGHKASYICPSLLEYGDWHDERNLSASYCSALSVASNEQSVKDRSEVKRSEDLKEVVMYMKLYASKRTKCRKKKNSK